MRRREFIKFLGVAAWPLDVRAESLSYLMRSRPSSYTMSSEKRVSSMNGGSNVLTLTERSTFRVADQVIVEVGGEAGQGQFGTMGVGGVVPAARNGWST